MITHTHAYILHSYVSVTLHSYVCAILLRLTVSPTLLDPTLLHYIDTYSTLQLDPTKYLPSLKHYCYSGSSIPFSFMCILSFYFMPILSVVCVCVCVCELNRTFVQIGTIIVWHELYVVLVHFIHFYFPECNR